eukprot:TRINITY_DN1039_c0_g1_i15.p1 TRINITY_DN1039_c0_g1~~TRINITY_DN1039_c0_g1_i15.p1  ORF type:complete len:603 (-),score=76.15 TRINITY_DN1039_c0_g1_i15:706-2514(-)
MNISGIYGPKGNIIATPAAIERGIKCIFSKDGEASPSENVNRNSFQKYPVFVSRSFAQRGVDNGSFIKGKVQFSRGRCFVKSKKSGEFVLETKFSRNRSFLNDIVCIRPLGKNTGSVIHIFKANRRPYVCTMLQKTDTTFSYLFVPQDKSIPFIRINSPEFIRKCDQNKRFLVEVDNWPENSLNPVGHITEILGEVGNRETEIKSLLYEQALNGHLKRFSEQSEQELPQPRAWQKGLRYILHQLREQNVKWEEGDQIDPELLDLLCQECGCNWFHRSVFDGRRDLTHLLVFSIDPESCEDIDDALSVRRLDHGWEIGIHIADVSTFVAANGALDLEARERATSVYLDDRRLDMLPLSLSSDLCSLLSNVERFSFSMLFQFNEEFLFMPEKTWFGRSIIVNSFTLSYDQCQTLWEEDYGQNLATLSKIPPVKDKLYSVTESQLAPLCQPKGENVRDNRLGYTVGEGPAPNGEQRSTLGRAIAVLTTLAIKIKDEMRSSSFTLESLELDFELSGDNIDVSQHSKIKSMDTIANWMIFANAQAAEILHRNFPGNALLRKHPPPEDILSPQLESIVHSLNIPPEWQKKGVKHLFKMIENSKFFYFL